MEIIGNIPIPSKHELPIGVDVFFERNKTQKPVVIFSHGFKGFKGWGNFNFIAKTFADNGFVFVKFNFSHNGTTIKKPAEFVDMEAFSNNNFSIEMDDLACVIDWVLDNEYISREEFASEKLYLIGFSRGGGISILKAYEDKRVKKLVTWSGVNDFSKDWNNEMLKQWKVDGIRMIANKRTNQMMSLKYQIVEDYQKNINRLHIPTAVKNIRIPFLIIHGTKDETIPYTNAVELKSWNENAELFPVQEATHTYGSSHPPDSPVLPPQIKLVVDKTIEFLKGN